MHCTADLLNWASDSKSMIKKLKSNILEAHQKAEAAKVVSKLLEVALSKVKAELAKVKAD